MMLGMAAVCSLPFISLPTPAPEVTGNLQQTLQFVEASVAPNDFVFTETTNAADQVMAPGVQSLKTTTTVNTYKLVYFIGAGILLLTLLFRLLLVLTLHLRSRPNGDATYRLLHPSASPGQAFTFGSNLYFSSDVPDNPDFDHILAHERVHAGQLHSLDILFNEVFLCLFWFHPAAWWLRAKMRANLEYLVDKSVINNGTSRRSYQLALVRQSQNDQGLALALPFSEPSLKDRIIKITGMNKYRLISLVAAVGLMLWMGIAMALINGPEVDTNVVVQEYEMTDAEPYEAYYAEKFTDLFTFNVYANRLPTVDEYYQLKAIASRIPETELYIYKKKHDTGYSMRLDHFRNVPAVIHDVWETATRPRFYRIGLNSSPGQDPSSTNPWPSAGFFTPVVEEELYDRWGEQTIAHSDAWSSSQADLASSPIKDGDELIVTVNGKRIELAQPNIVPAVGRDAEMYLFDNGKVAPIEWEQNMHPPSQKISRVRMEELLGCSSSKECPAAIILTKYNDEVSNRKWFESLELPDRKITGRYNDQLVQLDDLLDKNYGPESLIQVGYRSDGQSRIFVQVIDDGPGQVDRAVKETPKLPFTSTPDLGNLFSGEPEEINLYFKRLPTPVELEGLHQPLKAVYPGNLYLYRDCTDSTGLFTFAYGKSGDRLRGQVRLKPGELSSGHHRFQFVDDGKGGNGTATFRPQPLPDDAPDADILLFVDGMWIQMTAEETSPVTENNMGPAPFRAQLNCQLELTPENKANYNVVVVQKSNITFDDASYAVGFLMGTVHAMTSEDPLGSVANSNYPTRYFLGTNELTKEDFLDLIVQETWTLTIAGRNDGPSDLAVVRLDPVAFE
jgi:hypothetical protein